MFCQFRALVLLFPAVAMMAAEGDPAPAPAPAPAAKPAVAVDNSMLSNLDLRLTLGGGGAGINTVRDDDLDVEADYENGSSGKLAVHLIYLRARPGDIGFAVGGGLFAASHTGELDAVANPPEVTVNAAGIDVYAAFVYRPTKNWHFELPALVLSGGQATVETEGGPDSDDGWYHQSALQVGAYYTFDFGLQLGVDLGASWFYAVVEREFALGVDHTFIYSGSGAYFNLNAGFRF
jgi:hypothetical protein